jgi:hypothetical protein
VCRIDPRAKQTGSGATFITPYNGQGLRVAQSVDSDVTEFAWDWATGVPEMLTEGGNLYLVGHETLGSWDGATWAYHLPDALGSLRQEADTTGAVLDAREWTPYALKQNMVTMVMAMMRCATGMMRT